MDVSFSTPALAALCNSEDRLARRWGPEIGRTVARRLLDMAAGDAADLGHLPEAVVGADGHETVVTFGGKIEVRGDVYSEPDGSGAGDRMVISGVDVLGRTQR
jgi:hypothetical protein